MYKLNSTGLNLTGIHHTESLVFLDLNPSGYFVVSPQYITCTYNPQPDITAYELAQIIPYFHGKSMTANDWESLGPVTRHLKKI